MRTDLIETLRATHWHKGELESWDHVQKAIPDAIQSGLLLWARRIERKENTPHLPHKYLFVIVASHYAKREDGAWAPDGQELTFVVAAETSNAAYNLVKLQLDGHGLTSAEWCMCTNSGPLILVS